MSFNISDDEVFFESICSVMIPSKIFLDISVKETITQIHYTYIRTHSTCPILQHSDFYKISVDNTIFAFSFAVAPSCVPSRLIYLMGKHLLFINEETELNELQTAF